MTEKHPPVLVSLLSEAINSNLEPQSQLADAPSSQLSSSWARAQPAPSAPTINIHPQSRSHSPLPNSQSSSPQNNTSDSSASLLIPIQSPVQRPNRLHNHPFVNSFASLNDHDSINSSLGTSPTYDLPEPLLRDPALDQPPPPPPPSTSIKRMSSMISSNRASESDAKRTAVASDGERLDFKKNFFILSHAGKPIYCRYGDESKLSGHMGVMQAILSFHSTDDDELQSVEAGTHRYVFLRGGPLYLVAVSSTGESETQLRRQLKHLYNQILFILTQSQLEKIFKERENYDLRRLLMGTETFFDNMADQFLQSPGYCLEAIECVKMERGLREQIGKLFSANVPQSLLFGAMFAGDRLVTLIRPKRHTLHPTDIRLITNMVTSSTSFQSVESWTPICLPHFHSRGFLHAYVSFIGSSELYLVLISNDRDAFFSMSAYKDEIVEGVSKQPGLADQLEGSLYEKTYSLKDVGIPGLRHFVYKSKALMQYIQASRNPPYTNSSDYERLLRLYQYSHARSNEASFGVKVGYFAAESESVLAWITQQSELYVTLDPFATKIDAISIAQKLQKWIKAHEELVFLDRAVVF